VRHAARLAHKQERVSVMGPATCCFQTKIHRSLCRAVSLPVFPAQIEALSAVLCCAVLCRERERRVRERGGGDLDEARLREAAGDKWKEAVQAAVSDLKAAQVGAVLFCAPLVYVSFHTLSTCLGALTLPLCALPCNLLCLPLPHPRPCCHPMLRRVNCCTKADTTRLLHPVLLPNSSPPPFTAESGADLPDADHAQHPC
jgi:hypothetical protein